VPRRRKNNAEHPIVALIGIVAIVVSIVGIAWAHFALNGAPSMETALADARATGAPAPRDALQRGAAK
jgi:hypothetical protein